MTKAMIGLAAATALLTTGCLRAATTVEVNPDGTGTASVEVTFDPTAASDFADQAGGGLVAQQIADADPAQLCDQARDAVRPADLPATATVTPVDEDARCGQRIDFTFTDGDDLARSLDAIAGGQATDVDQFVLEVEGDDWVFEGPLVGINQALQTSLQSLPDVIAATILDQAEVTFELTMPGDAVADAHNADEVDGGRFRWEIDPADPEPVLLARTTTAGSASGLGGSSMLGLVLLALGVIGALIVGALVLSRSRATANPAVHAAAGAPGGLPSPGTPGETTAAPTPGTRGEPDAGAPAPGTVGEADAGADEPRWDPHRGAWVVDHPSDGLLVHDDDAGEWRPAP